VFAGLLDVGLLHTERQDKQPFLTAAVPDPEAEGGI
jgi:hypothetical protein